MATEVEPAFSHLWWNPAKVPLSNPNTWMSLAWVDASMEPFEGPGWYLRGHHNRNHQDRHLFRIRLPDIPGNTGWTSERDGIRVRCQTQDGSGYWEAFFDTKGRFRIRSHGLPPITFFCPGKDNLDRRNARVIFAYRERETWVVNNRAVCRKYAFHPPADQWDCHAPWMGEFATEVRMTPKVTGLDWEGSITEIWSTLTDATPGSWEEDLAQAEQQWQSYRNGFSKAVQQEPNALRAVDLLYACEMPPSGFLQRPTIFMSLNWMDQVWSWDNLFNAAALAPAHPQLAEDQIATVFDHQDAYGVLPDGLNDSFRHYNFNKPPVQGILIDTIEDASPAWLDESRLKRLLPGIEKFTQWWLDHRRDAETGLCYYLHGNDSGWDNTTLLREGSPLIAPDLNTFLSIQCRKLSEWHLRIGQTNKAAEWLEAADNLATALVQSLWNGQSFDGIRLPERQRVEAQSMVTFMPLLLGEAFLTPKQIRVMADGLLPYLTPWGPATENPTSPFFQEDGYWRGPVWGPSSFLLWKGLMASKREDLAHRVREGYLTSCRKSGFPENFSALSGKALKDPAYTWTASVYLLFQTSMALI